MKQKTKYINCIIIICFAVILSIIYYFNMSPYWDFTGTVRFHEDFIAFGHDSAKLFQNPLWFFNIDTLLGTISYCFFGYTHYAMYFVFSVLHGLCCLVALFLLNRGGYTKIYNYFIYFILMLPDGSKQITEDLTIWRYTHKEIALAALVFLLLIKMSEEKYNIKRIIINFSIMVFVCVDILLTTRDQFLLIAEIILPFILLVIYRVNWDKINIKFWTNSLLSISLALIIISLVGFYLVRNGLFQTGIFSELHGTNFIVWYSVQDITESIKSFFQEMLIWFSAFEVGKTVLSPVSLLYVIKMCIIAYAFFYLFITVKEMIKNPRKVNTVDAFIVFQTFCNLIIAILFNVGFRYSSILYYTVGIMACRQFGKINFFSKFVKEEKYKQVYFNILVSLFIFSVSIFLFFISYQNARQYRERYAKNTNFTTYNLCDFFNQYAEANNLKYGFGSYNICSLLEVMADGMYKIQPLYMDEYGNISESGIDSFYNDFLMGCNYHNFIVEDSLRHIYGVSENVLLDQYGDYKEKIELYDDLGQLYMTSYLYDYDVRWRPLNIYCDAPMEIAPDRNRQLESVLPLGTYYIKIVGSGINNLVLNLSNQENENIKLIQTTENEAVYELTVYETKNITWEFFNRGDVSAQVESISAYCKYAAVDIDNNSHTISAKEIETYNAIVPEGKTEYVFQGEGVKNLELVFADNHNIHYTVLSQGTKNCVVEVVNEGETTVQELRVYNTGHKEIVLDKFAYQLNYYERGTY